MSMLDHALARAREGFPVFPCIESGERAKAPYTKHGALEATRGEAIIREWWEEHPNALIGGKVPRTALVLDIDPRNGGSMEKLVEVTGPLPPTLSVGSGRHDGGTHLYFRRPSKMVEYTKRQLPKGIDLLVNGYCILPPSIHPATGRPYFWLAGPRTLAQLPERVVTLLKPPPRKPRVPGERGNVEGLANTVAYSDPGSRNDLLFWAARTAHEEGGSEEDFEKLASAGLHAGLTETEVRRTIASGRHQYGDQYDN